MKQVLIYRDFEERYEYSLGANEKLQVIFCDISTNDLATNFVFNLGEGAEVEFVGAALKYGKAQCRINYHARHVGAESKSSFVLNSLLDDSAKKHSEMRISFLPGAINANGSEHENCSLLSNETQNISLPCIDTREENMRGEHGMSSGHIPPEQVEYLRMRGFDDEAIKRICVYAGLNQVFSKIRDDDVLQYLKGQLAEYEGRA